MKNCYPCFETSFSIGYLLHNLFMWLKFWLSFGRLFQRIGCLQTREWELPNIGKEKQRQLFVSYAVSKKVYFYWYCNSNLFTYKLQNLWEKVFICYIRQMKKIRSQINPWPLPSAFCLISYSFINPGVHKFSKNIGTTSNFYVPAGWHEASSIVRTQNCWVPQYKI